MTLGAAFRRRMSSKSVLMLLLLLVTACIIAFLLRAVAHASLEEQGIEPPRVRFSETLFSFLWIWGKVLAAYAAISTLLLFRFENGTKDRTINRQLMLPEEGFTEWAALVLFVYMAHIIVMLIYLVVQCFSPFRFDTQEGFLYVVEIYFIARIFLLSSLLLALCRLLGYLKAFGVICVVGVVRIFMWLTINTQTFPDWTSVTSTPNNWLELALPWKMPFVWPLHRDMLADSMLTTHAVECALQNLLYTVFCLILVATWPSITRRLDLGS